MDIKRQNQEWGRCGDGNDNSKTERGQQMLPACLLRGGQKMEQ